MGNEAREETASVDGLACLVPGSLDHTMVSCPEAKLDDVSLGDVDSVWCESKIESADRDGDDFGGTDLRDQASCKDQLVEHHFGRQS